MKDEFIKLLKETNREGMDKLIKFLEESDFFEAPASTRYHGNWKGGLLEHSMKVYEMLKAKTEDKDPGLWSAVRNLGLRMSRFCKERLSGIYDGEHHVRIL